MADDGASVPVIAGIAAGAGMVILFSAFFVPSTLTNPEVEKTVVSYEPTQCSTPPWASYWNQLRPDDNFQLLAEEEQQRIIKDYYREKVGIMVFEVGYRWSESPSCLACGCSAGYIIDFQVNESDVSKLREDILKATVDTRGTA